MHKASILWNLEAHKNEVMPMFQPNQFVMIGLQGSQNYGLDIDGISDIDTKFVLAPTFKEIAMNKKPVSTTHIRANEEHTDLKDIRLMLQTFKKQNMNFVELLFTEYKLVNPLYAEQWERLVRERETIAHYSPYTAVKTMKGIAMEKYHAMEHPYPSKLEILYKYGYDGKQLHHLLRVLDFLERYISGEPYENCLRPLDPEYLKSVKQFYYKLDEARSVARNAITKVNKIVDDFTSTHECTYDSNAANLIDDVQYQIMKIAVEQELK